MSKITKRINFEQNWRASYDYSDNMRIICILNVFLTFPNQTLTKTQTKRIIDFKFTNKMPVTNYKLENVKKKIEFFFWVFFYFFIVPNYFQIILELYANHELLITPN